MRLKKNQKEALLAWISEGLQTDEINARGAVFDIPFQVSRQQVDFYRDRHKVNIASITEAAQFDALRSGLALRSERVKRLQQLAALMEEDIFADRLWVEDVKAIGSGPFTKFVDFEKFNASEVSEYRGILDDIAKEMGDRRSTVTNINVTPEQAKEMTNEQLEAHLRAKGLL